MASLEALGLASNIIQVIDFVSKLITNARTLYKSADQTSTGSLVLQDVANDLARLCDSVTATNCPEDEGLKRLAQSAKEVSNDILVMLDDLKIKGQKTRWKSFLLAIKEVRSQDAVTSVTSSITRLQTQMTLHIQFQIKSDMVALSTDIQMLQSKSDQLQLKNATKLEKLRTDLLDAFDAMTKTSECQRNDQHGHYEKAIRLDFERLAIGDFHNISQRLPTYKSKVSALSQGIGLMQEDQDFIKSFYFSSFSTREERIIKSHAHTFEWVFRGVLPDQKTKIGFPSWLQSGNGIFWVRGKAGSGKSTLMKFIGHHPITLEYLRRWSGSQQLIMGRFYFWNSGTDLQKSQEGLLRSLIFEILRQCPELATHAKANLSYTKEQLDSMRVSRNDDTESQDLPQIVLGRTSEAWTTLQLTKILSNILSHNKPKKFFFIIDGLDEYQAQYTQDHQNLITALQELVVSPNVKLCVSSRPWTVFMDAFDGNILQCLKLEDLTKDDIRSYVTDKFLAHNQYEKLILMDSNYSSLVNNVVEKSQGVFLWVFLVVRELMDGLTYNDTLRIMEQRLDNFPDTLEEFFQHMLNSVPRVYRQQTTQIFDLAVACSDPLPMIYYSLLEDVNEHPDCISQHAHIAFHQPELLARRDTMQRRLDAWCKGLLEIVEHESTHSCRLCLHKETKVDFLHQSVRDFIMSGDIVTKSKRSNPERLCTWLQFCNAVTLFHSRLLPSNVQSCSLDIKVLALFAKKAQDDGADTHTLTKIMLQGCNAVAMLHPYPQQDYFREIILQALPYGLTDFIKLLVLSAEVETVSDVMHSYLPNSGSSEMISWLISCVRMKGLSSKAAFDAPFRSFISSIRTNMNLNQHRLSTDEIINKLRTIASTGYQLDDNFIIAHYPTYYWELKHGSSGARGKKRELEEDTAQSQRKRIHPLD
ncbi:hypothetical protein F4678DRAFT_479605 [Xylaria arbuscula]|nr:hypothetical protein F4678DRAFT_479605 [Xylaria arbuscula]